MGFYIRKRVQAGPFRFNISKSGIGVSAGVPGFRVGSGPRGNYVSVGGGGVTYRTSLGGRPSGKATLPFTPPASSVYMEDVSGAQSVELQPTGRDDIVDQLNRAAARLPYGWIVLAVLAVVGAFLLPLGWPYAVAVWVIAIALSWFLFLRDQAASTVVLFYDVNDSAARWFEQMVSVWPQLQQADRVWRTVSSGGVRTTHQHKTNAGASSVVDRQPVTVTLDGPKHLSTNVAVPTLTTSGAALYFLPDRLLVRNGKSYVDVDYTTVHTEATERRFVENPANMPRDAQIVDETWKYVNVDGSRDKRYKANERLPVALYGNLDISSSTGLNWRLQTSRPDAVQPLSLALTSHPSP